MLRANPVIRLFSEDAQSPRTLQRTSIGLPIGAAPAVHEQLPSADYRLRIRILGGEAIRIALARCGVDQGLEVMAECDMTVFVDAKELAGIGTNLLTNIRIVDDCSSGGRTPVREHACYVAETRVGNFRGRCLRDRPCRENKRQR